LPGELVHLAEATAVTVWTLANAIVARQQAMSAAVLCVLVECVERAATSPLCSRVLFNLTAATAAAAASFEMTSHLMGFALVTKTPADGSGAWCSVRSGSSSSCALGAGCLNEHEYAPERRAARTADGDSFQN
jgi:hypothetical protein